MLVLAQEGSTSTSTQEKQEREEISLNTSLGTDTFAVKVEHWLHTTSINDPEGTFRNAPDIFDLAAARDLEEEEKKETETAEAENVFDALEPPAMIDPGVAANFASMPGNMSGPSPGSMAGVSAITSNETSESESGNEQAMAA